MENGISQSVNNSLNRVFEERAITTRQANLKTENVAQNTLHQEAASPPNEIPVDADVKKSEIVAAVKNVENYMQNMKRELEFSIDERSGNTVVKVIDPESKEVIRQMPSEEFLKLSSTLHDNPGDDVVGVIMNRKA